MTLRNMPIRRKLMVIVLLTTVTAILLMRSVFLAFEHVTYRNVILRQTTALAQVVAANSTAALAIQNLGDATETLAALQGEPHVTVAALYDKEGTLFARYPADIDDRKLPVAAATDEFQFKKLVLTGFQPVTQNGNPLGTLYLEVDTRPVLAEWFWVSLVLTIVVIGIVLAVAYLLSRLLQGQISQPILALAQTARAVSERRDYSVRAAELGRDELGLLTHAFNQMLTKIQEQNLELSEGEARVRAILNSALSAVVVMETDGRITDWNPRAEEMFGWPRAAAIGRNLAETIVPPHLREAHNTGLKRFLATGEGPVLNRLIEMNALRRDGREFPVELSISPMQSGGVVRFCGFVTDITKRKEAENQLRSSFKEISDLKAALDEHAIVAITDSQGKITFVNDKFCAISKYSREELLGQDHRIINSRHHSKEFIRDLWTTIAHGRVWHGEIKNRAKDGSFYWVDTTIVPFLNDQGKPRQYVAIRADITESKRVEEEVLRLNAELEQRVIKRTAELETVNKELEAFSYSISHDLRAPLRAVNGFAGIVLEDFSSHLPEEGRQFLKRIRDGGQRMGELIDDLLAFSRLSRQTPNRQTVDMVKLVQSSLDELHPEQAGRLIDIRIGELSHCVGDWALLKQVWVNLISNAVKYTRGRALAVVEIGCTHDNNERVYFIRDNGTGFDMQYVHKLFGVFQRLHRLDEFEGTGVGLAIVQRIIHRHGGRVWADAAPDRGATFYFTVEQKDKS